MCQNVDDNDGIYGKKVLANSVPAAAVIQKVQALFIVIGRKRYVGCFFIKEFP